MSSINTSLYKRQRLGLLSTNHVIFKN